MNDNSTQNHYPDRFEERQQRRDERWARRQERSGGQWMWGILLILLAGILFLQNQHIYIINNWWALFILLPAMGSFAAAWRISRDAGGKITSAARNTLIVGVVFLLVAAMFLFNLNWTILGPVLLALAGIGLLANGMLPH